VNMTYTDFSCGGVD